MKKVSRRDWLVFTGGAGLFIAGCKPSKQSTAALLDAGPSGDAGTTDAVLPRDQGTAFSPDGSSHDVSRPDGTGAPADAGAPVSDAQWAPDGAPPTTPDAESPQADATGPGLDAMQPDGGPGSLDVGGGSSGDVGVDAIGADRPKPRDIPLQDAALLPPVQGRHVLEFDGDGQHVNHGFFFPPQVDLGNKFFWEMWVRADGTGYVISDGYGGSHVLLFGFQGFGEAGSAGTPAGNIFVGQTALTFGGDESVSYGEWVHIAVGGDGEYVHVYVNGVCTGKTKFPSGRKNSFTPGAGILFVGGSDHINFKGRIAWMRAWDDNKTPIKNPNAAFVPERRPSQLWHDQEGGACDFLADYTYPQWVIQDFSRQGCRGARHPGQLFNTKDGSVDHAAGDRARRSALPLPRWVVDPGCPVTADGPVVPAEKPRTPIPLPDYFKTALAWDSFARPNQTYAFQALPSLGSIEAGSIGQVAWKTSRSKNARKPSTWGILNGSPVYLGDEPNAIAWVDTLTADHSVSLDKRRRSWSRIQTGMCFRVVDEQNYRCAILNPDGTLTLRRYVNGQAMPFEGLAATPIPIRNNWEVISVICRGEMIYLIVDFQTLGEYKNQATHVAGTGCGLAVDDTKASSLFRWMTFVATPS